MGAKRRRHVGRVTRKRHRRKKNPPVVVMGANPPGARASKDRVYTLGTPHFLKYRHRVRRYGNRIHKFEVRGTVVELLKDGSIRIYNPRHRLHDE